MRKSHLFSIKVTNESVKLLLWLQWSARTWFWLILEINLLGNALNDRCVFLLTR